ADAVFLDLMHHGGEAQILARRDDQLAGFHRDAAQITQDAPGLPAGFHRGLADAIEAIAPGTHARRAPDPGAGLVFAVEIVQEPGIALRHGEPAYGAASVF